MHVTRNRKIGFRPLRLQRKVETSGTGMMEVGKVSRKMCDDVRIGLVIATKLLLMTLFVVRMRRSHRVGMSRISGMLMLTVRYHLRDCCQHLLNYAGIGCH